MASNVEEIKERLAIEDVVGSYIKLDKSGTNFKARCPFHNEKTPSFYVSPERHSFYCFGCNAKGDIFTFVERFEGIDFMGALRVLADRAGVSLSRDNVSKDNRKETLYEIMENAAAFYEDHLKKDQSAHDYVLGRGITEKTIANFRIGYAPNEWRTLRAYLKGKSYKDADVEAVGLIKKSEKSVEKPGGDPYYDTFRGRIMFPISDSSGRVVAFTGRTLDETANPPKYLNSPETVLFKKSKVLFGLDKAKMDIRKRDYAILVEGQMDCVMLHQAGYSNAVAASGTAFVESANPTGGGDSGDDSAFTLLTRLSDNIVVAFDSDSAGQKAVKRIVPAISLGMNVKIIDIKGGKDPADIVKTDPTAWRAMLESKKDFIDYLVDSFIDTKAKPTAIANMIKQDVFPYIAPIPQDTPRSQAIHRVAEKLMISENALWRDFEAYMKANKPAGSSSSGGLGGGRTGAGIAPEAPKQPRHTRLESIERKILGLIYSKKYFAADGSGAEKKKELYDLANSLAGPERIQLFDSLSSDTLSELTLEADITYEGLSDKEDYKKEYKILILHLEEEYLRQALADKMAELQKKERGKEEEKAKEIMQDIQKVTKRMQEVKRLIALI